MRTFFETIGWTPIIGDPSLVGWLTVFAYFLTACSCLRVHALGNDLFEVQATRQKRLWLGLGLLLMLLCVNKQLDLQSLFTATAKYLFIQFDLYEVRGQFQKLFIFTISILGVITCFGLLFFFRAVLSLHLLAIVGVSFLTSFVLIRASSFHKVDMLIGHEVSGVYMNWILELAGILLVFINAVQLIYRHNQRI